MSKRDDIVNELIRRLKLQFSNTYYFQGDGGVWGVWGRQLPAIHYYEMPASWELVKPGMYTVTLPIQIEYFTKLRLKTGLYEEGREKLEELQQAIELDERLSKELTPSGDLAYTYSIVSDEIIEVMDNLLGVGVIYEIKFTERFLGYQKYRH